MSDAAAPPAPPPPAPPAPPQSGWQKAAKWVSIVVGIMLMLIGAVRLFSYFNPSLPACTSSTATQVLRSIFKQKDIQISDITNPTTVTESSTERTCQAQIDTPSETGTIYYRVYWREGEAMVMISKVDAKPR